MTGFLLAIHVLVAASLIGVILMQRSDGGALGGIGGGSDPFGGVMSGRGSANLLSRTTAILAVVFMAGSLLLAVLESMDDAVDIPSLPAGGGAGEGILEPVPPAEDPAPPTGDPAPPIE